MKGRGFGNLTKGERITRIAELSVGCVVLTYSHDSDAGNTLRVTRWWSDKFWGCWVNPLDPTERWGDEFCRWEFELGHDDYWLAVFPEAERPADLGFADLPLFQEAA